MSTINLSFRHDLPQVTGGHRVNHHLVASADDSDFVLRGILKVLELTPAKLGRLVGRPATNAYHWFSISTPSQAYWVRIAHLLTLAQQGVDLGMVRTIDWSRPPYQIEWWPGAEPKGGKTVHESQGRPESHDAVRDAGRGVPSENGNHQRRGSAGSQEPAVP